MKNRLRGGAWVEAILAMPRWLLAASAILLNVGVGAVNYALGGGVSLVVFYLVGVSFAAWFGGLAVGVLVGAVSGVIWFVGEDLLPPKSTVSYAFLPYWNLIIKVATTVVVAWLFQALRRSKAHEEDLAGVDSLTGAVNRRSLFGVIDYELRRMPRMSQPISLAFVDLDDFKEINDTLGHRSGDEVLRAVARAIQGAVREVDTVARVGGDEFIVLLPGAGEAVAAEVMGRVRDAVARVAAEGKWPLTMSGGVVTCERCPTSAEELVGRADAIMYEVKKAGKARLVYSRLDAREPGDD